MYELLPRIFIFSAKNPENGFSSPSRQATLTDSTKLLKLFLGLYSMNRYILYFENYAKIKLKKDRNDSTIFQLEIGNQLSLLIFQQILFFGEICIVFSNITPSLKSVLQNWRKV